MLLNTAISLVDSQISGAVEILPPRICTVASFGHHNTLPFFSVGGVAFHLELPPKSLRKKSLRGGHPWWVWTILFKWSCVQPWHFLLVQILSKKLHPNLGEPDASGSGFSVRDV